MSKLFAGNGNPPPKDPPTQVPMRQPVQPVEQADEDKGTEK